MTPRAVDTAPVTQLDPIRVLVCDDSAAIRGAVARMLEADPSVHVVARSANGRRAVDEVTLHLRTGAPVEVVVLDIEMPVMDGLTALPELLRVDPSVRVLMSSSLTVRGAEVALRAVRLGASDYIAKPGAGAKPDDSFQRDLIAKVKGLAATRRRLAGGTGKASTVDLAPPPRRAPQIIAVGSSTGGPQALFTLMQGLGRHVPAPVLITQHMPATFTPILADHLNRIGGISCTEARDGEVMVSQHAYLAPGNRHLLVEPGENGFVARLSDAPAENFCRPAVDPMLRSAVAATGGRVLAVILTGMGHDGLSGAHQVVSRGGGVVAQDEASSVVWGMPGAVVRAGLCYAVAPLSAIAGHVLNAFHAVRP